MKFEFSYYQCKDGHYGICNVPPEHILRNEKEGLWTPDDTRYKIEQDYYRKEANEDVYAYYADPKHLPNFRIKAYRECNVLFSWHQLLDLSNIPKPKWEDKTPILVVLDVSPKTSYYVYD